MLHLKELVEAVQQATLSATEHVKQANLKIMDTYFEEIDVDIKSSKDTIKTQEKNIARRKNKKIKPKTVIIQYPKETANGFETHDVHVPILTLLPVTMPQISELKFTTDLELHLDDNGDLKVGFPSSKNATSLLKKLDEGERKSIATLEIVFNASNMSTGLQKIVEGYEKALRAQIPY